MGADVSHASGGSAPLWIGAPRRLLWAQEHDGIGKPALGVLDDDLADLADGPVSYQLARLFDHRVARVVVCQHEHLSGLSNDGAQLLRLGKVKRGRLVADNVEAGFQRSEEHTSEL